MPLRNLKTLKKPKMVQIDLFVESKKGSLKPNPKLVIVKQNRIKEKIIKLEQKKLRVIEKQKEKVAKINTKIEAYNLAWQVIHSNRFRSRSEILEEAWWIVKKMSPAKGKNKIGKGARFHRVFNPTISNLKGLEVEKLRLKFAQRFIEYAKQELRN